MGRRIACGGRILSGSMIRNVCRSFERGQHGLPSRRRLRRRIGFGPGRLSVLVQLRLRAPPSCPVGCSYQADLRFSSVHQAPSSQKCEHGNTRRSENAQPGFYFSLPVTVRSACGMIQHRCAVLRSERRIATVIKSGPCHRRTRVRLMLTSCSAFGFITSNVAFTAHHVA